MFIGNLEDVLLEYRRMGSDIKTEPVIRDDGALVWGWSVLSDTGLDIHADLGRECYLGSVTIPFQPPKTSFYLIEILSEDRVVGRYTAETGKLVFGTVTVPVGASVKEIIIRIYSSTEELIFMKPEFTVAYDDGEPLLWPRAKSAAYSDGEVKISSIVCEGGDDAEFAKSFLSERLTERFGNVFTEDGVPVTLKIGRSDDYSAERFTLNIRKNGITLTAAKRLTLLYAVCALTDLGRDGSFPVCEIDDKPSKEMRGVHIGFPKRENIGFVKRLFKYVLLPLRYNQLIVQFCGGVRYDSHPEIAEEYLKANERARAGLQPTFPHDYMASEGTVLEKHEVRDILDCARELGFEIIPEVQSLGHVQWITNAHPEIAEREENDKEVTNTANEDLRPANFYTHCYCPSNEKSYEIVFDILEEVIDLAKPERYVHMGHDEVYHLGLCEKCKNTPHAELFARDINRYYNFLKKKGLGMAIWSDMLQPVTKYQTYPAKDLIPKDILMLDFIWYFHLKLDIEENLIADGFENVMIGNLYSSHFPRYRKRMTNESIRGGQVSLWCALNEERMAEKGKFWELEYTADMLWNPERYDDGLRCVFNRVLAKYIQPRMRDSLRGVYTPAGYKETAIPLPDGSKKGIPASVLSRCPDAITADGAKVEVGGRYDRLVIEHTTLYRGLRNSWTPLFVCGAYTVEYSDGEKLELNMKYSGGIQWVKGRYGMPLFEANYRHDGYIGTWQCDPAYELKSECGEDLLVLGYIFENPFPDKEIKSLSYRANKDDFSTAVLAGVKGLNKN